MQSRSCANFRIWLRYSPRLFQLLGSLGSGKLQNQLKKQTQAEIRLKWSHPVIPISSCQKRGNPKQVSSMFLVQWLKICYTGAGATPTLKWWLLLHHFQKSRQHHGYLTTYRCSGHNATRATTNKHTKQQGETKNNICSYNTYIYSWNPNNPCFDWSLDLVLEGCFG